MAEKKRILIVTQEMNPYTMLSKISDIVHEYSQFMQESGMEVRILMPKFGSINERRHRLHEVVRLSGINISVGDDDYPLIIKVASLPNTRMQVYFLDNDEFFKRKQTFEDDNGVFYEDNIDRMFFFCRGVVETVKKFGWAPHILHAHGWMTSLLPAFLKTAYHNEPIFQNTQIIYSAYPAADANKAFENAFEAKAVENGLEHAITAFMGENGLDLNAGGSKYAEGTIIGMEDVPTNTINGPKLDFQPDFSHKYLEFFEGLMSMAGEKV